jgi:uncharacterized protein YecT (DUF1311 family)
MEPEGRSDVHAVVRTPNWTTIALIGALVILILLIVYFTTGRNLDQDKLVDNELAQTESQGKNSTPEKLCASKQTFDLIKHELFRRAAQLRGSDAAAFDQLSGYAVLRMENPVLESEDSTTGAVNCSGSLSIDLPPGVSVVGGRRSLTSDVDYTVQAAADGSGTVVQLRNGDAIIAPLATLARTGPEAAAPPSQPAPIPTPAPGTSGEQAPPVPAQPGTADNEDGAARPVGARPSFDCARARTKGEIAVCSNAGLAALDRNMAAQFARSIAVATPQQRTLLRSTRDRFIAYRDRCPNRACIGDAYVGRMREIRDIMEGRWEPPR